jgi:hypothetical protein
VALLAALGLLLLAAGLLAGSAVASVELRRATRSLASAARAGSETRRALGEVLQRWDGGLDSLPIGGIVDRPVSAPERVGPPVAVRAQVRRLNSRLFAASVTVRVGDAGAPLAVRRVRLLLERAADTGVHTAGVHVVPLARWGLVDLH